MFFRSVIFLSVTLLPVFLEWYARRQYLKRKGKTIDNNKYRFILLRYKGTSCRTHIYNKIPCSNSCSLVYLREIVSFISTAKRNISVCAYHLSSTEIADELVNRRKKGLNVRFITDEEMAGCSGSQVTKLLKNRIPVKTQQRNGSLMHHKFCVIDVGTPNEKMFVGSMNLTMQGLCCNFDDMTFTNNSRMISRFSYEFEELWEHFPYRNIKKHALQ